jgi:hypothetical protein
MKDQIIREEVIFYRRRPGEALEIDYAAGKKPGQATVRVMVAGAVESDLGGGKRTCMRLVWHFHLTRLSSLRIGVQSLMITIPY